MNKIEYIDREDRVITLRDGSGREAQVMVIGGRWALSMPRWRGVFGLLFRRRSRHVTKDGAFKAAAVHGFKLP